jgi:hypothetical protein
MIGGPPAEAEWRKALAYLGAIGEEEFRLNAIDIQGMVPGASTELMNRTYLGVRIVRKRLLRYMSPRHRRARGVAARAGKLEPPYLAGGEIPPVAKRITNGMKLTDDGTAGT